VITASEPFGVDVLRLQFNCRSAVGSHRARAVGRDERADEPVCTLDGPDDVDPVLDGSHLLKLWRGRAAFYPPSTELLRRFMVDCLRARDLAAEGHRVVARYAIEERLPQVRCPVLVIGATADPYAYPSLPKLRAALPHLVVTEIAGGMVPLPDQLPEAFAAAVETFLDSLDRDHSVGQLEDSAGPPDRHE